MAVTAEVPKRFSSLIVELPVQQTGSGDPSPENIRPITQWTDVALYVADTDTAIEPTVSTILPTPIFGGMVDVARGEVASLYNVKKSSSGWEMVEEGQFRCQVSAFNNGDETSTNVADLYSSHYKTVSNKDAYDATDDLTCGTPTIEGVTYLYVNDLDYSTLEAFTAYIGNVQFVYKSHVPMSDVIEPTIVYLPEGTSYVWADAGYVELTVQGTPPLSLPNSLGKPLKAWEVGLEPYQDLHGYDSPWPAGGGKNLLKTDGLSYTPPSDTEWGNTRKRVFTPNSYCVGCSANNYYMPNQLTEYSISENRVTVTTDGVAYGVNIPIIGLTVGETYTISATAPEGNIQIGAWQQDGTSIGPVGTGTVSTTKTFTVPENAYFILICLLAKTSNVQAVFTNIQLEKGSTATSFAPYENLCPIHGTDKVTVWTDSKYGGLVEWNQLVKNGNFDGTTNWSLYGVTVDISNNIAAVTFADGGSHSIYQAHTATAGHKYFASITANKSANGDILYRLGTNTNLLTINGSTAVGEWVTSESIYNLTTAPNSNILAIYVFNFTVGDVIQLKNIMLCDLTAMFGAGNEPSTVEEFRALFPNDYYAYNAGQQMTVDQVNGAQYSPAVITLPSTVYTATVGSEGGESRYKLINARDISWRYSQGTVYCTPADLYTAITQDTPTGRKPMQCNIAKYTANTYTTVGEIGFGGINNNGNIVFNNPVIAPDIVTWRQYIADNDVMICYPLATPTTFALTTPSIPTPKGNATTWATAEDGTVDSMSTTYIAKPT